MSTGEQQVREVAARVAAEVATLRGMSLHRRAESLARAAALLLDPRSELGEEARALLPASTGLGKEMVEWGLRTTLETVQEPVLRQLVLDAEASAGPGRAMVSPGLVVVVLSSNVFTASVRALFVPLLLEGAVVAKASSKDDVMPRLLARALREVDPALGACLEVLTFPGGATSLEDALFAQADVVSVHGGDQTLAEIRGRLPGTVGFVGHGHGLGAAYVPASALVDEASAVEVARRVAMDVAAYDQRGCMSPHAVWIERGGRVTGERFAGLLAEVGLRELARTLPRGSLPLEVGSQQVQWRGVGAARGTLFEGDGYAASHEGDGPLRLSPGYRNVGVYDCDDEAALGDALRPLGKHLKTLGVAADARVRRAVAVTLPPPLAPRVCAVGEMQTPPFSAHADGELPWTGVVRYSELR